MHHRDMMLLTLTLHVYTLLFPHYYYAQLFLLRVFLLLPGLTRFNRQQQHDPLLVTEAFEEVCGEGLQRDLNSAAAGEASSLIQRQSQEDKLTIQLEKLCFG